MASSLGLCSRSTAGADWFDNSRPSGILLTAETLVMPPPGGAILAPFAGTGARPEGTFQALGVREPLGRLLGQAPQHDALEVLGDGGAVPRGRNHRVVGVRDHDPNPIPPVEWRTPGQQIIGHRPQRVEVAPFVH